MSKKEKHIINGWLNVDKPKGLTSADVVNIFKKILKPTKIGHTGTLDPMATGVLPVALGEATKLIQFTENKTKTYEFNLVFGAATDTEDAEGEIVKTTDKLPNLDEIHAILPDFTGKITQTPPIYSALKIDGKRAYELAREGKQPEMKQRTVEINLIEIIKDSICYKENKVAEISIRAEVSRGTYIRSLARDIALKLGTLGHINMLKRVKDGGFEVKNSINISNYLLPGSKFLNPDLNLQSVKNDILNHLSEIDSVLDDIPVLDLNSADALRLHQGQKIPSHNNEKGVYRLYNEGDLQAMVEVSDGLIQTVRGINL